MPNAFDFGIIAALVIWQAWDHFFAWPRFTRSVAAGEPGVRARYYWGIVIGEWLASALVVASWLRAARPFGLLGVGAPSTNAIILGALLAAALAVLITRQVRAVAKSPTARSSVQKILDGPFGAILPRTEDELPLFHVLSVTAGICEEFLCRGFLMWFIGSYAGVVAAVIVSSALFGLAHAYQGKLGIVRSGILGAILAGVYLATHSLYPGIVLHAMIDIGSGLTIFAGLRAPVTAPAPSA